jgi:hypothetical protein
MSVPKTNDPSQLPQAIRVKPLALPTEVGKIEAAGQMLMTPSDCPRAVGGLSPIVARRG